MEKSEKITECTMATDICDIRDQIDAIDNTILELINRRLNLARRIGELKKTVETRSLTAAGRARS